VLPPTTGVESGAPWEIMYANTRASRSSKGSLRDFLVSENYDAQTNVFLK
jgi:hypothetical protein